LTRFNNRFNILVSEIEVGTSGLERIKEKRKEVSKDEGGKE